MTVKRYLEQRLKMHHLRAVEAVTSQKSLLKAASVLGITQPAITKTLQELEHILQQRLFDRLPRGVRPTEAGQVFATSSSRILAEIRRLDEELDRISSSDSGTVAVGALPVAAAGVLPGTLTKLKARHPDLRVRLEQGRMEELMPKLISGEIDLIVGRLYDPILPDGYLREALWEEPISVLARVDHPIFRQPRITVEALRAFDLVLPTVSQRVGQEIEAFLARLKLEPSSSLRSSSYGFIREMLHATDMISAMPRLMMAGDLLRATLRVIPLPVEAPSRPAGIVLPPDRVLPPAGTAFLAALREHVAEIGQRGLTVITVGNGSAVKDHKTRTGGKV
jgi:LysR family pca operon transcriptional activator